jgi:hypothetical protein
LKQQIKNFDMEAFVKSLQERKDEVCEDIWDILIGFTDFQEFKSLMLSYKEVNFEQEFFLTCLGIEMFRFTNL